MTFNAVNIINAHDWMRQLHLPLCYVARLRRLRVGERLMVGHHETDNQLFAVQGACQAYFERINGGGFELRAHYRLPVHAAQVPTIHSLYLPFKLLPWNRIEWLAQQDALALRTLRRYLSFQRQIKVTAWRSNPAIDADRRRAFQFWDHEIILKRGFTQEGQTPPEVMIAVAVDADGKALKPYKGRQDCAQVLHRINQWVYELKLFTPIQLEEQDGVLNITLCNLWRIQRRADGTVRCFEHRLAERTWHATTNFKTWPKLEFWPISKHNAYAMCKAMYYAAFDLIFEQAGLRDLPVYDYLNRFRPKDSLRSSVYARYICGKNAMFKRSMPYKLWAKVIFKQLLDPDLFKAVLSSHWKKLDLKTYLHYAMNRKAVLRVAREHKNLLPLLEFIPKSQWKRLDLFAHANWLNTGQKSAQLSWSQVKPIFDQGETRKFYGFHSPAAFRWLKSAPYMVVKTWSYGGVDQRTACVIENIVKANIQAKVPVVAWTSLLVYAGVFVGLGVHVAPQRIYRAFINHCAQLWQDKGFIEVKRFVRREVDFVSMYDWLRAEGLAMGHPHKNATWESLKRHSRDWHQRVALVDFEHHHDNRSWQSAIEAMNIDGHEIIPLTSHYALHVEGREMHHCINDYADLCVHGKYRAFSIKDAQGMRSTLGLKLAQPSGTRKPKSQWVIEQHRAHFNDPIEQSHQAIGHKVMKLYNQNFSKQTSRG